jgi:hypothetical protein
MSILKKLFGRGDDDDEGTDAPVSLDAERRRVQLIRLEQALDALAAEMRAEQSMDNPGWQARVNEYSRLAGAAMQQRQAPLTREGLLARLLRRDPGRHGEDRTPAGGGDVRRRRPPAAAAR